MVKEQAADVMLLLYSGTGFARGIASLDSIVPMNIGIVWRQWDDIPLASSMKTPVRAVVMAVSPD